MCTYTKEWVSVSSQTVFGISVLVLLQACVTYLANIAIVLNILYRLYSVHEHLVQATELCTCSYIIVVAFGGVHAVWPDSHMSGVIDTVGLSDLDHL